MGLGVFIHHIGTLLLLVATALLVVSDISAPVVNNLSILNVDMGRNREVNFGTFGWCDRFTGKNGKDDCSSSRIGYNPAGIINDIDNTRFGSAAEHTAKALTNVMVLHAVGTGLSFIGFLLCLGTSLIGSLTASIVAALAFIVTAVAVICDFIAFSIIKHDVNKDNNVSHARYGVGIWCVLAAAVCTFLATLLVFVTCCAGKIRERRRARSHRSTKAGYDYEHGHGTAI